MFLQYNIAAKITPAQIQGLITLNIVVSADIPGPSMKRTSINPAKITYNKDGAIFMKATSKKILISQDKILIDKALFALYLSSGDSISHAGINFKYDLEKKNIHPLIVDLQKQPEYLLRSIDIIPDLIPESHLFKNFNECTDWIKNNV